MVFIPQDATDFRMGVYFVSCCSSDNSVFTIQTLSVLRKAKCIVVSQITSRVCVSSSQTYMTHSGIQPVAFILASIKGLNPHNWTSEVQLPFSTLLICCACIFFICAILYCLTCFKGACCVSLCEMKCFYNRNNSLRILFVFLPLLSFISKLRTYLWNRLSKIFISITWGLQCLCWG